MTRMFDDLFRIASNMETYLECILAIVAVILLCVVFLVLGVFSKK